MLILKEMFFLPLSTPWSLSSRGDPITEDRYQTSILCYHAKHSVTNLKITNYLQNIYDGYKTVHKKTKPRCNVQQGEKASCFSSRNYLRWYRWKRAQWTVNYNEIVMSEIQIKCFWAGLSTNRRYWLFRDSMIMNISNHYNIKWLVNSGVS